MDQILAQDFKIFAFVAVFGFANDDDLLFEQFGLVGQGGCGGCGAGFVGGFGKPAHGTLHGKKDRVSEWRCRLGATDSERQAQDQGE